MTDIKVGQIWGMKKGKSHNIVITSIDDFQETADYIWVDGVTVSQDDWYFVKLGRKLITDKYKTWQEAVNSKEFNDE